MRLSAGILFAGMLLVWWGSSEVRATPAFSRQYRFTCAVCHAPWPRLNDYGVRFRRNAYQRPDVAPEEETVFQRRDLPLSGRVVAGYSRDRFSPEGMETQSDRLRVNDLS